MNYSIVLSTQQTQFQAATMKGALEDNLAKIAAMGYQGVELAIRDPRLIDLPSLSTLIDRHGLKVPAIGTGQAWGEEKISFTDPDPAVRQTAIDRIISDIPAAAHFNASIIIGLIRGLVRPGVSDAQAMDWLVHALQICCLAAEPYGVKLALEPINRYETTLVHNVSEGLALIQRVGAENLGLLLDTFHMNIEETNIEDSIADCGHKIFHFHAADSNRHYPGAGHLNFLSILTALSATGYGGFVSGEFLPLPDADTAARKAIQYLKILA
jgi:sugar phosphate isomerase/epimerase